MQLSYHVRGAISSHNSRSKMIKAGITMKGDKLWTESENAILRQLYPDFGKIRELLPHRTIQALWPQCRKLGMKRSRHRWLASEVSKLRKIFPTWSRSKICEVFPGMTWNAIDKTAHYYGVRRAPRKHRRTGKPLIDGLLTRIEEIGWTLRDLDEESGTGTYFQDHGWRYYRLNFSAFAKAVRTLDGELQVEWKQY